MIAWLFLLTALVAGLCLIVRSHSGDLQRILVVRADDREILNAHSGELDRIDRVVLPRIDARVDDLRGDVRDDGEAFNERLTALHGAADDRIDALRDESDRLARRLDEFFRRLNEPANGATPWPEAEDLLACPQCSSTGNLVVLGPLSAVSAARPDLEPKRTGWALACIGCRTEFDVRYDNGKAIVFAKRTANLPPAGAPEPRATRDAIGDRAAEAMSGLRTPRGR